jgi:hypothetical protein
MILKINPFKATDCNARGIAFAGCLIAFLLLPLNRTLAAEPAASTPSAQTTLSTGAPAPRNIPFDQLLRPSRNPINAYRGKSVAPPSLANSARLDSLVRDGTLYLSSIWSSRATTFPSRRWMCSARRQAAQCAASIPAWSQARPAARA